MSLSLALFGLAGTALGLAPRADRVTTTGGLALTTTVRVVDRVHGDTTDGRALALPAHAAGLAPVDVGLLGVADLADGGAAAHVDVADLTGGHPQRARTCPPWPTQLDARRRPSGRSSRRRRAAARPRGSTVPTGMLRSGRLLPGLMSAVGAGLDPVALLQLVRRDDVALLAVGVVQQRDARGAVRVVLDVRDLGRHAVLVVATEVDHAVGALVATTLVPGGDPTVVVAATLACAAGARSDFSGVERVISAKSATLRAATTRGRRLVLTDTHGCLVLIVSAPGQATGPPKMSMRSPSARRDDRALGVLALAEAGAGAPRLPCRLSGVDRGRP